MGTNEPSAKINRELQSLIDENKEIARQQKENESIVDHSGARWLEGTINKLSEIDDKFEPIQVIVAKTLGVE
jgi:hypothetical protein